MIKTVLMMNELITMDTETLEKKLDEALQELIPLFKVSKKELKRFKKAAVIIKPCRYPAYIIDKNQFEFPGGPAGYDPISIKIIHCDPITKGTICHEASHYIHYQINHHILNSNPPQKILQFACQYYLDELIAEYSNCRFEDYSSPEIHEFFKNVKQVYDKLKIESLPRLSRMSYTQLKRICPIKNYLQKTTENMVAGKLNLVFWD